MGPPYYKTDLEPFLSNQSEPVGAKLYKLNKFLKSVTEHLKSAPDSDKDQFIGSIPNDTYFGKKTRLELANILQRPNHIFEIWKSEDTTLLHRSLKTDWIFKDSTLSPLISDPDFLVNDLFPNLSHSCRNRIAKQIGKLCVKKDAENVTKIYTKLLEKYGINLAKHLLPSCSQQLIDSVIEEKLLKFEHNQLLTIYKKYPESGLKYLNSLYQVLHSCYSQGGRRSLPYWGNHFCSSRDSCSYVLSLLVQTDPTEFMNLFEKYDSIIIPSCISIGRKLTQRLIKQNDFKQRIISSNKASSYAKILCKTVIINKLTDTEFDTFFVKLFPKNVRDFQAAFEIEDGSGTSLFSWLKKYAPEKRFEKLDAAFQSTYSGGKSILDNPELVTSKLLQLLSPELRNKWVDIRLSKPDTGSAFLFNLEGVSMPAHLEGYWEGFRSPADKSITRIKQYLHTEADVHRRGDLLSSLVLTCAINKDTSALKEVCQFVSSRYRNDTPQVRLEFLATLSNMFNLLKLDEDHWKPLNELLHISSINNEFSYRLNVLEKLIEKSIHFRVGKNLPVDTQIQHYIKMKSRSYCMGESWCLATDNSTLERKCLQLFTEHLSSMYPTSTQPCPSDSAITSTIISLFESYAGWNRRRKQSKATKPDQLNLLSATESPWLMKRLQDVLDSYHESNKRRVIMALNNDPQTKAVLHPRLIKHNPAPPIFLQLIKKDPKKLDELMDEIIDFILASNKIKQWGPVLQTFKTSGLSSLVEKFGNKCLEIAEDEEESLKERSNSIYVLSYLLSSHNFVGWIPKYYPSDDPPPKYDHYTAEEIGVVYGLRKMITQCLTNLRTPSAGISALGQFCKGDYLKLTVGSLYSIVEKSSPSSKLIELLNELVNRPVSVKKHAIRLKISISTKEENIQFLKTLWDSEKHQSIRTILFNQIFSFYIQNNSQESAWELLKSSVNSLSSNDVPFLSVLAQQHYISKLPNDKISEYFELAWNKVGSIIDTTTASVGDPVKINLLQCINPENIQFIEETFIHSIFDQLLFNLNTDIRVQSVDVTLAINYLLHYPKSSPSKKMEKVAVYLKKHLLETDAWNKTSKDSFTSYPARQSLSFFVEQLTISSFNSLQTVVQGQERESEIIETFSQLQKFLHGSSRDVCDFFVDDLFISFALVLHTSYFTTSSNNNADLVIFGKEIGKLLDETLKVYKPEIVSIFSFTLKKFISRCYDCRRREDGVDQTRIIFIVEGIMESTGSIDTKILASQLLFNSNFNIHKGYDYEEKYVEIITKLRNVQDKTVQVFVNFCSAQHRSNGGFDILV